ncbi:MAG: hypothetical protein WAV31_01060 [Candidatus Moraniibacteriota bacterium]
MNNYFIKKAIVFVFSIIIVLFSVTVIQKSDPSNKNGDVYFGYPFGFVKQNFNDYDPIKYYQKFSLERASAQTEFLISNFIFSVLTIFLVSNFLIYVLEILYFKIKILYSKKILNIKNE